MGKIKVAPSEETPMVEEAQTEQKSTKSKKSTKKTVARTRSKKYQGFVTKVEKNKTYSLSDALSLVEDTHMATFDETVELHINTLGPVSGGMNLPHGTGKSTRVAVLAPSKDAEGAEALLKEIESGKINFDVLIATPDAMPKLAKVAKILGPKGLMPNPKNGTVTPKPEEVAKQYEGGHMTFKTEAKAPVLHLVVGKLSFGKDKLSQNISAAIATVGSKNIRNVTLKSTMSLGVKVQVSK
ncbi:MAG TPA: 50S ribosomal protein L1 [Patescibacteria group bacterium]|nr:50S ribosomal protein L1 [Patescibacteria group bacterium]